MFSVGDFMRQLLEKIGRTVPWVVPAFRARTHCESAKEMEREGLLRNEKDKEGLDHESCRRTV